MNTAAKPAPSLWQGLRVALDALEDADADATLVADALALVGRTALCDPPRVWDVLCASGWTPAPEPERACTGDLRAFLRHTQRIADALDLEGVDAAAQAHPEPEPYRWQSVLDPIPYEQAEITAPDLGHPRPALSFDLRGLDQLRAAFADLGREMNEAAHRAWPSPRPTHTLSVDPATFRTAVAAVRDTVRPAPWTTGYAERARGRALRWRRLGEVAR